MTIPAILFHIKIMPGTLQSLTFHSAVNKNPVDDHRRFRPPPPVKLNNNKGHNPFAMIYEMLDPLYNIHLSVEMLKDANQKDDQQVFIDVIGRCAKRLNNSINLFLFAAHSPLSREENSMYQLIDEVLDIAHERITRKRIVVSKEYNAPDNKIILNRPAVKIALINIIMNAIDAMETDKGQLKLTTALTNDKYLLTIANNGPGISVRDQETIFKPYFSKDADARGLANAFYILHSNYIGIEMDSRKGSGTCFILSFQNT